MPVATTFFITEFARSEIPRVILKLLINSNNKSFTCVIIEFVSCNGYISVMSLTLVIWCVSIRIQICKHSSGSPFPLLPLQRSLTQPGETIIITVEREIEFLLPLRPRRWFHLTPTHAPSHPLHGGHSAMMLGNSITNIAIGRGMDKASQHRLPFFEIV